MVWCYVVAALVVFALVRRYLESLTVTHYDRKAVLITGCDTGFGNGLALQLAADGFTVFGGCLTKQGEEQLRHSARHLPGKLISLALDVTDQASVDAAVELVQREQGTAGFAVLPLNGSRRMEHRCGSIRSLWAVVNNAGILGAGGPEDWLKLSDYQQALDVNSLGVVRVTHAFSKFVKQARGRIVTVTSVAGRIPFSCGCPYTVSKYAAEAYCDVIRQELLPFGVSVHILEPGFFATNILNVSAIQSSMAKRWDGLPIAMKDEYGEDFYNQLQQLTPTMSIDLASTSVNQVVEAYMHAITARFPRKRYCVGNDSKLLFIPLSLVPTRVQDLFLYTIARWVLKYPKPKATLH